MLDAWSFWDMTPAEIAGRITAHRAAQDNEALRDDRLAWMVGLYTAKGVNDPKRFPKKPDMIRIEKPKHIDMDDDGMQTVMTAFAEVHNAIEVQNDIRRTSN